MLLPNTSSLHVSISPTDMAILVHRGQYSPVSWHMKGLSFGISFPRCTSSVVGQ